MSGPSSLPEREKPAPDVPSSHLNPVRPEHKGASLCWMWFAERVTRDTKDPTIVGLLENNAPRIASELLKTQYQLDVTAEAIQTYYDQARKNADMAGAPWITCAVAVVMRSQGSEPLTYDEFKSLLDNYKVKVSSKPGLCFLFCGGLFHVQFDLRPLTAGSRFQALSKTKMIVQCYN